MADIKVNAQEWNNLSEAQRSEISSIIKKRFRDDRIVADPNASPSEQTAKQAVAHFDSLVNAHQGASAAAAMPMVSGKILCDIGEAAAVAACALVPAPGNALCIAAAHAAAELCRQKT